MLLGLLDLCFSVLKFSISTLVMGDKKEFLFEPFRHESKDFKFFFGIF